jgi:hypothetical protein
LSPSRATARANDPRRTEPRREFDSEEALQAGNAILDQMNPPDDMSVRRLSVEVFEVLVQQLAP